MRWQVNTPPRNATNRRTQGRIDLSKMEVRLSSTTWTPHHVLPRAAFSTCVAGTVAYASALELLIVTFRDVHLQAASLRRYRKVHKLGDVPPNSSKEDLLPAVARHFAAQASTCCV